MPIKISRTNHKKVNIKYIYVPLKAVVNYLESSHPKISSIINSNIVQLNVKVIENISCTITCLTS